MVEEKEQEQIAWEPVGQGVGEMPFLHQDPDTPHRPHGQMHLDITFPTVLAPRSFQLALA